MGKLEFILVILPLLSIISGIAASYLVLKGGLAADTYIILMILLVGIVAILLLILVLSGRGILSTVVNARFTGSPILITLRPDMGLDLEPSKIENGLAQNKYGFFNVLGRSIYMLPNGVKAAIAHFKYGSITLPPEFIEISTRLKEMGINDYRQLEEFANSKIKIKEKIKDENGEEKEVEKEIFGRDITLLGTSLRIQDVENMFKYAGAPSLIESKIKLATARQTLEAKSYKDVLMVFVIVVGVLAFAYIAFTTFSGGGSVPSASEIAQRVIEGQSRVVSAPTLGGGTNIPMQ